MKYCLEPGCPGDDPNSPCPKCQRPNKVRSERIKTMRTETLITRLENSSEGNTELDAWVCALIGMRGWKISQADGLPVRYGDGFPELIEYTRSMNAALMLLPEGKDFGLAGCEDKYSATVFLDHTQYDGVAKTLPLAICALALRINEDTHQ